MSGFLYDIWQKERKKERDGTTKTTTVCFHLWILFQWILSFSDVILAFDHIFEFFLNLWCVSVEGEDEKIAGAFFLVTDSLCIYLFKFFMKTWKVYLRKVFLGFYTCFPQMISSGVASSAWRHKTTVLNWLASMPRESIKSLQRLPDCVRRGRRDVRLE